MHLRLALAWSSAAWDDVSDVDYLTCAGVSGLSLQSTLHMEAQDPNHTCCHGTQHLQILQSPMPVQRRNATGLTVNLGLL